MTKNRVFLTIITLLILAIGGYAYAWVSCYREIGFIPKSSLSVGVITGSLGSDTYEYKNIRFTSKGPAVAACLKDRFHI